MNKNILIIAAAAALTTSAQQPVFQVTEGTEPMPAEAELRSGVTLPATQAGVKSLKAVVKDDEEDLEALYQRPDGGLFWGFSAAHDILTSSSGCVMLAPAYADLTWANLSTGSPASCAWTWDDTDSSSQQSTSTDLVTNYRRDYTSETNQYSAPILTVTDDNDSSDTYQRPLYYIQAGGNSEYNGTEYGVGTFDYKNEGYMYLSTNSKPTYGYSSDTDANLASTFGLDEAKSTGLANLFEKPERPYYLRSLLAQTYSNIGSGAKLKLSIIEVDDEGTLGDTLAVSTATTANRTTWISYFCSYTFTLDTPLIIDSSIYVSLEGFNDPDNVTIFALMQSSKPTVGNVCHAYFEFTSGDDFYRLPTSVFKTSNGVCYNSFLISLYMDYEWLEPTDDDLTYDDDGHVACVMPASASSKTFNIEASTSASGWTCSLAEEADWLTVTVADNKADTDVVDGRGTVTFAADENTTGAARETLVTLSYNGASTTFAVSQTDESGVAAAKADGGVKVASAAGQFVVTAPESVSGVSVYNIAGQLVGRATVSGSATIDASGLASGVYLLRFSDGTTVKVVK